MDERLNKEVKVYEILNGLTFSISSFALSITRMISIYKFNISIVLCFVLGVLSFVISPYLVLLFKKGKKLLAIASGLIGPSSVIVIYMINMRNFNRKFGICLVIVLICIAFIRVHEVKKAKRSKTKKKEILKSVQVLATAVCVITTILSVPTGVITNKLLSNHVDESEIISSTIEATNNAEVKNNSLIKAHLKELMPIIDGTYSELSLAQRLDIFQIIVNIECTYFGSSIAVPVKVKPISTVNGITYAYYNNDDETIYLNESVFNDLDVEDALYIVLHEARHVYQYEQKKLYESVPNEFKSLSTLSGAKECKKGLDKYIQSEEDYEGYKNQKIEQDAEAYAYVTTAEYLKLIKQYSSDADFK
ncbi:hypothetical protein [Eubacterium sp.]|mgnify:CR=1 FL=1|uniref:hypothetical protein n=1 Tax=uncultured Eubacterium sp. TaxID=165185 RepID=UPI0025E8F15C|nr:hypothetical protein [uncultured Eubacterium sp.]